MRKCFVIKLLILFYIIGCQSIIEEEMLIDKLDIQVNIDFNKQNENDIIHVYFYNINDRNKSEGFNLFNNTKSIDVNIFPGTYNIYSYCLIDKTSTSKKVYAYNIIKDIKIFNNNRLSIKLINLMPKINILLIENNYLLEVDMDGLYEIFSLSSLSIKQSTERVKSLSFTYNKIENKYVSTIPEYIEGDWYANISYSIKSKKDSSVLDKDNIYISTSYFKDIFLGNF